MGITVDRDTLSASASELKGKPEEFLVEKTAIETQIGEIEASWTGVGLNISEAAADFNRIRQALASLTANLNRISSTLNAVSSNFNNTTYGGER